MKPIIAVIAAGGKGLRFSRDLKKQFLEIEGRPLLYYTIKALSGHCLISDIIIVLPPEDISFYSRYLAGSIDSRLVFVEGGSTRALSVINGLRSAEGFPQDLVLIHDSVRPFIKHSTISRLYRSIDSNAGAVPVLDVFDTAALIEENKILKYLDRNKVKLVQTPQLFKKGVLLQKMEESLLLKHAFTDESSLLDYFGLNMVFIKGDIMNLKLTCNDQEDEFKMLFKIFYKDGYLNK